MIRRLTILLLIVGCEEVTESPAIEGCTTATACNYDATATKNYGSCDFESCDDCYGIPHGVALLDSCGVCDADITNDNTTCSQGCDGVWGSGAVTLWGEYYAVEGTTDLNLYSNELTGEIPQEVCNLYVVEGNALHISNILNGNNLTNTCE